MNGGINHMQQLCFLPVMQASNRSAEQHEIAARIDETKAIDQTFGVWLEGNGALNIAPLHHDRPQNSTEQADCGEVLALLRSEKSSGHQKWYLVTRSGRLGLNGITPPLPVAQLRPGALLSIDQQFWLVSTFWKPQPGPAPPEVADKECPVCGAELAQAPVVQCFCGRWTHLERPEQADDGDALNCYLAAPQCADCERPATLDPLLVPEPSEKLLDPVGQRTLL
jgi:hypothetical protein